ncbi:DUF7681 family protein [Planktotalea sp.]|uniref:Acb2/Tad1 domain-containing protein n=1 Tax=Planktotalea sp. TaxID=2029877 RepID=UPI003D6B7889
MSEQDNETLYQKAVEILTTEQKASTSFLQRQMSIGYNKAAMLMERAEQEGVVSKPNHVGKRDVLIGGDGVNHINSTDDGRVGNSPKRHQYRVLSDEEKARMAALKTKGQELLDLIAESGGSRELSIARTKTEEAVMWAVKHVTS